MEDNTRGRGDGLHNRGLFKWGVFYCPRLPCGGVLLRGVFRKGPDYLPGVGCPCFVKATVLYPSIYNAVEPVGKREYTTADKDNHHIRQPPPRGHVQFGCRRSYLLQSGARVFDKQFQQHSPAEHRLTSVSVEVDGMMVCKIAPEMLVVPHLMANGS